MKSRNKLEKKWTRFSYGGMDDSTLQLTFSLPRYHVPLHPCVPRTLATAWLEQRQGKIYWHLYWIKSSFQCIQHLSSKARLKESNKESFQHHLTLLQPKCWILSMLVLYVELYHGTRTDHTFITVPHLYGSCLTVTNYRSHLISRIWKKNISWDSNFTILKNRRFVRELNFINDGAY